MVCPTKCQTPSLSGQPGLVLCSSNPFSPPASGFPLREQSFLYQVTWVLQEPEDLSSPPTSRSTLPHCLLHTCLHSPPDGAKYLCAHISSPVRCELPRVPTLQSVWIQNLEQGRTYGNWNTRFRNQTTWVWIQTLLFRMCDLNTLLNP